MMLLAKDARYWLAPLIAIGLLISACSDNAPNKPRAAAEEGNKAAGQAEYERGPHKGRMLRSGDFSVEVTIFEEGTDPEFHVYAFWQNKPLDPRQVQITTKLTRLGGRIDQFEFTPKDGFLLGNGIVREPHSFDVAISAVYQEQIYSWNYASYEGRTTITADAAEAGGVNVESAGSAVIDELIDLPGRVVLQPQARADVRARFPGRVVEMTKSIGETVRKGDVLVRLESSNSLTTYEITAPISGVIVERNANVGDIPTQTIYTISDSTALHAIFFAFPRDAERLREGQAVEIRGLGGQRMRTSVKVMLPNADPATQTVSVYADIQNPHGVWRPGMSVEGTVTIASNKVALAVRTRALQRFRYFTVVFAKVENTYEVRMLKLGRSTPEWTEVLSGLEPGEVYVSENAFLIRADIEKSGASHDH